MLSTFRERSVRYMKIIVPRIDSGMAMDTTRVMLTRLKKT